MRPSLTTEPIGGLVRSIALPASVGLFFNTMFNVVDTFFAGRISTQALAAMSLSFPVFFTILAISGGLSTGTTALIAQALGRGDVERARATALQSVVLGVLCGAGLTVAGLGVSPPLFRFLGAHGAYLSMCLAYMETIFLGSVFFVLNAMLNAVLNAQGDTVPYRNFLVASFFLNCALDPWFMYGGLFVPPLGITGVALSTVVIQCGGTVYLGLKVRRLDVFASRQAGNRAGRPGTWSLAQVLEAAPPRPGIMMEILGQGIPTSLNFATVGLGVFVITSFVSAFGKEAVAAYGVATRVEQIMLLPAMGLNVATVAPVAQNAGARRYDRVRAAVRAALAYGLVFMAAAGAVLFVAADGLMGVFARDPGVVRIGSGYLRIAAFVLYAYVILYVNVAALQGVRRPVFGLAVGVMRQVALPLAVFPILTDVAGLGVAGIWWGIFGITWAAALFTCVYARTRLAPRVDRCAIGP